MKHIIFPTVAQADAFVQDLQTQGLVRPELGETRINRNTGSQVGGTGTTGGNPADPVTFGSSSPEDVSGSYASGQNLGRVPTGTGVEGDGSAEDAGEGAVKGTGVGAVVGAVAGAVAIAATGGLAAPVVLGMAALGAGVGAGVGAIGGAEGVNETQGSYNSGYTVEDQQYDRMDQSLSSGGRTIAVEDSVPDDAVRAAASRHGGEFI